MSSDVFDKIDSAIRPTLSPGSKVILVTRGGEKVVGLTVWRDSVVIATTDRVLIFGPDETLRTVAVT